METLTGTYGSSDLDYNLRRVYGTPRSLCWGQRREDEMYDGKILGSEIIT